MGIIGWLMIGLGCLLLPVGFPGIICIASGLLILCWRHKGRSDKEQSSTAGSAGFKAGQLTAAVVRDARAAADEAVRAVGLDKLANDSRSAAGGFWAGLRYPGGGEVPRGPLEAPTELSSHPHPEQGGTGSLSGSDIPNTFRPDYGKILTAVFDLVLIGASGMGIAVLGAISSYRAPAYTDGEMVFALFIAKFADPVIFVFVAIACCFARRWSHACVIWTLGCAVSLAFVMAFNHPLWVLGPGIPATAVQVLLCFSLRRWFLSSRAKKNAARQSMPQMRDTLTSPGIASRTESPEANPVAVNDELSVAAMNQ